MRGGGCRSRAQTHLFEKAPSVAAMPEVLVPLGMMAGAAMGEWLSNRRSGEGIWPGYMRTAWPSPPHRVSSSRAFKAGVPDTRLELMGNNP